MCFIEPPRSQIPPPHNRTSSDQYFFSGHIIAILAAILFPVFARAREKARQTSCLSNVKQLSLGFLMYAQDYDETLPPSHVMDTGVPNAVTHPNGSTHNRTHWASLIFPYVNNIQVYNCPSTRSLVWTGAYTGAHPYGYNRHIGSATFIGEMKEPARFLLICDTAQLPGSGSANTFVVYDSFYPASHISDRHNGGANFGFADGHSKWLSVPDPTQFVQGDRPYDNLGIIFRP
ncbi:MAG: prepilin-type N-terminal cleavage/methylation domain-containing protein [Armatimonadota bacterium]